MDQVSIEASNVLNVLRQQMASDYAEVQTQLALARCESAVLRQRIADLTDENDRLREKLEPAINGEVVSDVAADADPLRD